MAATPLPAGDRWFRELVTPRLRITRLGFDDVSRLVAYRNDRDVAHFQDWPMPYTPETARAMISGMQIVSPCTPGKWFQFGLYDIHTGLLVGDVGLFRDGDEPDQLRVGYTLARDAWGLGLATEAVAAILDYAVAVTAAELVTADVLSANNASVRLLHRLGFEETAHTPRVVEIDGVWHDEIVYRKPFRKPEPALGAVLVGGAGRRMGTSKPWVEIGGATMFHRVEAALEEAGLDVVVVGLGDTPEHDHPLLRDPVGRSGPVAGISAALEYAAGRQVFVTAVDQPYLSAATIRRLLDLEGDLVVPVDDERLQVTCAVYRSGIAGDVRRLLEDDPAPSLQSLAMSAGKVLIPEVWRSWGEDGRSWRSLDTPEAVIQAPLELGDPVGME